MTRTLFAWPRHWFKRALKRKRYAYCGFLESEEALDRFLTTFFNQSLPKAEWGHTAHVAMAASLLYGSDVETVLPRVRQALRTYIEALGGRNDDECGYHETLTVFWLKAILPSCGSCALHRVWKPLAMLWLRLARRESCTRATTPRI